MRGTNIPGASRHHHVAMEGSYAAQFAVQSPFFYYNPDPNPENRQHGHFTPHPHGLPYSVPMQQQPFQDAFPVYHSNLMYQQVPANCVQGNYQPAPSYAPQPLITPVASPQPMYQKPTILVQQGSPYLLPLDTDCYAPATPPFSSASSAVSSPPSSCGLLPTPVNSAFLGFEGLEGVKEGCEEEVCTEILAGGDWSRSTSPPMTPGRSPSHVGCETIATTIKRFVDHVVCKCAFTSGLLTWLQCLSRLLRLQAKARTSFPLNPVHRSRHPLHPSHDRSSPIPKSISVIQGISRSPHQPQPCQLSALAMTRSTS